MIGLVYGYLTDEFDSDIHVKNRCEYRDFWKNWKDIYMKRIYKIDFDLTLTDLKTPDFKEKLAKLRDIENKLNKLPFEIEWENYTMEEYKDDYDVFSDEFKVAIKYRVKRDLITSKLNLEVKPYGYPDLCDYIVCDPAYLFLVELSDIKAIDIHTLPKITPDLNSKITKFLVEMGAKAKDIKCNWYLVNYNSYYTKISV